MGEAKTAGEHFSRYYLNERDFWADHSEAGRVAAKLLDGEWQQGSPLMNHLNQLAFDSAAVFHDAAGFSSVQIVFRSPWRFVSVRIRNVGGELAAERIIDETIA